MLEKLELRTLSFRGSFLFCKQLENSCQTGLLSRLVMVRASCDRTKRNISRIGDVAVLVTRGEEVTANTIRGDIITHWVGNIILVSVMPALVVHSAVSSNG